MKPYWIPSDVRSISNVSLDYKTDRGTACLQVERPLNPTYASR